MMKFLKGTDGKESNKRVINTVICTLWVIYFFANLFWGKTLKETLEEYLFYMFVVAYGGVALERFLGSRNKQQDTTTVTKTEETTEIKKTEA